MNSTVLIMMGVGFLLLIVAIMDDVFQGDKRHKQHTEFLINLYRSHEKEEEKEE